MLLSGVVTGNLLIEVLSLIAAGRFPEFASRALSASRLIALPKSNGDVRLIAVGEAFRRVAAKALCLRMRDHFSDYFSPIQHGVSTACGSELLIHHIQLLLDQNADWVVLKTDVKNAFNSISRRAVADRLASHFPSIFPHFQQMYGLRGSLVFASDSGPIVLSSEEGVHQGDPLGPVLFAVGIHDSISRLQESHPDVVVLAYLDDVFIIGLESSSLKAFDQLKSSFSDLHLIVADHKCEIFSRKTTFTSESQQLPCRSDGTIILGSPIGSDDFVSDSCLKLASKGKELCNKISALEDPQCALLLLRHCHATNLNHLGRTILSELLSRAASLHDDMTKSTFMSSLILNHLSLAQWQQATLPIRLGGFGVPLPSSVVDASFLAGWSHTVQSLPDRFSMLQADAILLPGSYVSIALQCALSSYRKLLGSSASDSPIQCISDLPSPEDKLQHRLKSEVDEVRMKAFFR